MHYHAEIIIPPTDNVQQSVEWVMGPFDESLEPDEDGYVSPYTFWDYWHIGGRWSGRKLEATLSDTGLAEFRQKLKDEGITVSGITFGKQTLNPASQASKVDSLWREAFPGAGDQCPFFDNYKGGAIDVCKVKEIPVGLKAERVIVASRVREPKQDEPKLLPGFMCCQIFWNGCNHETTVWTSNVLEALEIYKNTWPGINQKVEADWLCVTVDYHS